MLSMFNSAASDGPTLTPVRNKGTLEVISIIPRVILVGMAKAWKKKASPGRGGDLEGVDQVTHLLQIAIGHDEADVLLDEREELLKGRVVGGALADRLLHHGVLAHEDVTMAAHTSTDGLELLRGHIVGVADEDALVLGEESVGFLEISLFPCLSIPFDHFDMIRAVSDYLRYNDKDPFLSVRQSKSDSKMG